MEMYHVLCQRRYLNQKEEGMLTNQALARDSCRESAMTWKVSVAVFYKTERLWLLRILRDYF